MIEHPLALVLPHVRYRDWRFEVKADCEGGMAFCNTIIRVPDSVTGEPKCIVHHTILPNVPRDIRSFDWLGWLRREVHRIECHEADEHFVVAGERPFFPHED